jgi:putative SOS response-associated peptidase YedK
MHLYRLGKGQDHLRGFSKAGRDEAGTSSTRPPRVNRVVKSIHSRAIPVLLTTADEYETWFSAPLEEVLKL